ncbi:MAG: hypothetical protein ACRD2K_04915 [Terriglobales bacterium]
MMTELELREHRRKKWRLDGHPLRSADDAREFLESVGFCLMYPVKPPVLLPTFLGACVGSEANLPTRAQAFDNPRARQAESLLLDLLRQRAVFESNLLGEAPLLLAPSVLPYFYALVGDRNPKGEQKKNSDIAQLSPLARDTWAVLRQSGPLAKARLREFLGGAPSDAALERALGELGASLKIARVDEGPQAGATWDLLHRWAPEAVQEGIGLSVGESLSALVSRYLECVVAAEAKEVEEFFSHLAPRSRVRESVNALLSARELAFVPVGSKTLIQIAPPHPPVTFRRVVPAGVHEKPKGGAPRRRSAVRRQDKKA